jgi:acylphosphatase
MPEKTVRLRITGRVQGVGYRLWTTRTAAALGMRGWVRNRSDGSVEVLGTGAPEDVATLVEACRQGPLGACVTAVTVTDAEDDGSLGFTALPTE